jgi:hypothetical protein
MTRKWGMGVGGQLPCIRIVIYEVLICFSLIWMKTAPDSSSLMFNVSGPNQMKWGLTAHIDSTSVDNKTKQDWQLLRFQPMCLDCLKHCDFTNVTATLVFGSDAVWSACFVFNVSSRITLVNVWPAGPLLSVSLLETFLCRSWCIFSVYTHEAYSVYCYCTTNTS